MTILKEVCSIATAPFAEQYMIEYVRRFVLQRPNLKLSRDSFGNLLIQLRAKRSTPRFIFVAHMDHPGFVARRMIDPTTLEAYFRGWVHIDYVRGTKVRFFDAGREIPGVVTQATSSTHDRLTVPDRVQVKVNQPVSPGSPGMFDQGPGRTKGRKFFSRGIDDQGGVAAALAMLDQLHKDPPKQLVAVLLTRAEEEGFIGAIAACQKPKLLRKSDCLISIECSAMQSYAQQSDGAIIRVGDKTSIFNSDLTYFITQQAEQLAAKSKSFKYQRALMPGGTCEATVFDVYGFTAAAICVPLGNYHNMDREKKEIGPEYIDLADWNNMVRLFIQIARNADRFQPGHIPLRKRVEKRFKRLQRFLISPA